MKIGILIPLTFLMFLTSFSQGQSLKDHVVGMSTDMYSSLNEQETTRYDRLKRHGYLKSVQLMQTGVRLEDVQQWSFGVSIPGVFSGDITEVEILERKTRHHFIIRGMIPDGEVLLIQRDGHMNGQIRLGERLMDIQSVGRGVSALLEYDNENREDQNCKAIEPENEKSGFPILEIEDSRVEDKDEQGITSSAPVVRVLLLHTPNADNTGRDPESIADIVRGQWIMAMNNSNVNPIIEIAGIVPYSFVENTHNFNPDYAPIENDLTALKNMTSAQVLRDQYEADVVILLTDGDYGDYAGVAFLGPNETLAYGVVQIKSATAGYALIHEVGHTLGARHEIEDTNDVGGERHAWQWESTRGIWPFRVTRRYSSIMRSFDIQKLKQAYFSNPYITHAGQATGRLDTAYNARVINTNALEVCEFRVNPPLISIYGPASADAGDPLRFTSRVNQGVPPYTYQWHVDNGGGFYPAGNLTYLDVNMPSGVDLNIRLTVTDADGRVSIDTHFVTNIYTGGGCTICPYISGLDRNVKFDIESEPKYFPNPAGDFISVILPKDNKGLDKYEVLDINGKVIINADITLEHKNLGWFEINLSTLNKAPLILKLIGENQLHTLKVLRQ